ncbi:MAG: SirB2 family protein [Betaproteobacteria bacterium]|nr:SirB2 family protein [Betaproteobacteria bacterium]
MLFYLAVKYLHIGCVVLSGSGFFLRGLLMLGDSPLLQRRWLKIAPHVNDTVLLAAALILVALSGQYPFVDAWVTAKVFGLVGYIILGTLALRPGRSKGVRAAFWLAALAVFAYIVSVALSKDARGYFAVLG